MYASIMDLEAVVLFLKRYFREGALDVCSVTNQYRVFRFTFADGEQWNSEAAEIHGAWARELHKAKILDVLVPDIDKDTQYQRTVYCMFSNFISSWTLEINLLEKADPELAVSDADKRYLCEYREERLPRDSVCGEISDPSIRLMDAVQVIEKIALGKSLRYYDFCGGPEHITDRLNTIYAAFANGAKRPENCPGLVAVAPLNIRNLYAAADSARWFLQAMDTRNENLPGNLYEICGDAFAELRLQMNRAYRYVLNQL